MEREIATNRKSTCEWKVLWPPFLWRAMWLRGWGKISHLFRIICKYIAEMSCEHVSLFFSRNVKLRGHQSSQSLSNITGYSLAPSKAPSRRRQGSSEQEGRGTLALHLLAYRSIDAESAPCRHFPVAIKCQMHRKGRQSMLAHVKAGIARAPHPAFLPASRLLPTSRWQGKP